MPWVVVLSIDNVGGGGVHQLNPPHLKSPMFPIILQPFDASSPRGTVKLWDLKLPALLVMLVRMEGLGCYALAVISSPATIFRVFHRLVTHV